MHLREPRTQPVGPGYAATGRASSEDESMQLSNIFQPDAGSAAIAKAIRDDGYAIVSHLLDDDALARLEADLNPYLERTATGTEDFWGFHTKRFGALRKRSAVAQEMARFHNQIPGKRRMGRKPCGDTG